MKINYWTVALPPSFSNHDICANFLLPAVVLWTRCSGAVLDDRHQGFLYLGAVCFDDDVLRVVVSANEERVIPLVHRCSSCCEV